MQMRESWQKRHSFGDSKFTYDIGGGGRKTSVRSWEKFIQAPLKIALLLFWDKCLQLKNLVVWKNERIYCLKADAGNKMNTKCLLGANGWRTEKSFKNYCFDFVIRGEKKFFRNNIFITKGNRIFAPHGKLGAVDKDLLMNLTQFWQH